MTWEGKARAHLALAHLTGRFVRPESAVVVGEDGIVFWVSNGYCLGLPRVCHLDREFLDALAKSDCDLLGEAEMSQLWKAWAALARERKWRANDIPQATRRKPSSLSVSVEDPACQLLIDICGQMLTPKQGREAVTRWERALKRQGVSVG